MNRGRKLGSLPVRIRYFILLAVVCGSSFISMMYRNMDLTLFMNPPIDTSGQYPHTTDTDKRFTIRTEGCSMPFLHLFDVSVQPFVEYPKNLKPCRDQKVSLLKHNKSKITINMENLHYYNITDRRLLFCCYQAFYRPNTIDDITSSSIDSRVKYNKCIYFTTSINRPMAEEFVKVTCYFNKSRVYQQFYLSAPEKIGSNIKREVMTNETTFNVLILGIDAVSRLNFYRTMPKTASFLKDYGAIDFLGYNKVGDNTFPNLIPLLLGNRDSELKDKCLPNSKATFDNCPFVWEWFKEAGYYTAFAEDSSSLGMFNFVKAGFIRTPTDYYTHTFITQAERYAGYNKDFNSFLCMNDYYFYKVLLDYIVNLTNTLKNSKLFGFIWEVTMSHDHLNYPMVMDDDYLDFFKKLKDTNYLDKTVLFLMSDHGIRWGSIRSTKQGRLEERLPFMFIMVPPSFREAFPKAYSNLKFNSRRLTTPFDIHATLMDLVDLGTINNSMVSKRSKEAYARNRSISLFLPIPSNRTCKMADIDDHWCTCLKNIALHNESSEAKRAATHVLSHLNDLVSDYSVCARLSLVRVIEIAELEAGRPDENETGWKEYMVVLQTSPGDGVFEATVRYDSEGWKLSGTVSRLNLYGEQSRCVHDYHLKLYCYCI
ncbi:uncharacterized protein LOC110373064 [Helicoverpa armigera]|uniref:uncharacterized protein LOC110373064 n=1 Tax=Helicoverpa armigera TaxID=29058 RepID=UPI0030839479